jgi:hypothetical protein
MHAAVTNRHRQRDVRLAAEADTTVTARVQEEHSDANESHIRLKTQVELYTILCTEYRCVLSVIVALLSKLILPTEIHISLSYS